MWGYVGRRLLLAIPTLLGASIIVFAMVHLAPGDPIAAVLPVDASKEQVEDVQKAYGFDKPLPVRYLQWLARAPDGGPAPSSRPTTLPPAARAVTPPGASPRAARPPAPAAPAQEFVPALRAKGLAHRRVFTHVVKNAAPQIITVLGLQFGFQLGGSVLVEAVFSWPGTGLLLNLAIFQRDIPVLPGVILVLATFFVLLNLAVHLARTLIDPRIARH